MKHLHLEALRTARLPRAISTRLPLVQATVNTRLLELPLHRPLGHTKRKHLVPGMQRHQLLMTGLGTTKCMPNLGGKLDRLHAMDGLKGTGHHAQNGAILRLRGIGRVCKWHFKGVESDNHNHSCPRL